MRIEARSPGKMILIGEYAVLEGAISLVAAVDRMATVSMHRGLKGKFSLSQSVNICFIRVNPLFVVHVRCVVMEENVIFLCC